MRGRVQGMEESKPSAGRAEQTQTLWANAELYTDPRDTSAITECAVYKYRHPVPAKLILVDTLPYVQ